MAIIGVIISLSLPNTYKAEVSLAPEISSGSGLSSNLSDLASMVGVNLDGSKGSIDAIYPELYPQVVGSTPFLTSMFKVKVSSSDGTIKNMDYYEYIKAHQKEPWWIKIKNSIISIFKKEKPDSSKDIINTFKLTKEQYGIAENIQHSISCQVDKKTSIISIQVTSQDAEISAQLADTVQHKLQQYITNYRTKKARNDLEYTKKLLKNAKADYVKAQQRYSSYSDANEEVVLESIKAKQEEYENEMQLRYNIYNQIAQQVQLAQAKVQERTPAFTEIQPATVPIRKDSPKRMLIVLGFIMLGFVVTSFGILIIDAKNNNKIS